MSTAAERRRELGEAALAWLLGVLITCALFYPGWMSNDSMTQYAQARGWWRLDDVHPPLMALAWRLTDRVVEGPGGLFVLIASVWWAGLVACVWQLLCSRTARWLGVALVGLWPAALLILGHVWKDVAMAACLLVACAAGLRWRRSASWASALVAALALAWAAALRHNGVFAALVLVGLFAAPTAVASRARRSAVALSLALAVLLAPPLIARASGALATQPWTAVALWDLAALSIAADEVLIPAAIRASDLSVDELREGYRPWANPPLFAANRIRLSFYVPYSDEELAAVRQAWLRAIREHPMAYVRHRAALARHLLVGYDDDVPSTLVVVPTRELPPQSSLSLAPPAADALAVRAAHGLWRTPLFAGALYLALALVAMALAATRRTCIDPWPAYLLASSALANALPLVLISGSAEFRYLTWTVLAALLAACAALAAPRASIA